MKKLATLILSALAFGTTAQTTNIHNEGGCGTVTPQSHLEKIYDFVQHNPAAYHRGTGAVDSIPLSLHIVGKDDGTGYYSLTNMFQVICQLNDHYTPANFHFYIKWPITFINNTSYYVHDFDKGEEMMQQNNKPNSVNVYFVQDPAGNCGYYDFSGDAVAISKGCAASNSTTLTHELGHFFSLPHTFAGWESGTAWNPEQVTRTGPNSNCNSAGDGFCDTYADYIAARWSCPAPIGMRDNNGDLYHPDSSVYMSYSLDACQSRFSDQEIAAMQSDLHFDRNSFAGNAIPHPRALDTLHLSYPADTLFAGKKKAVWRKVPGAEYYYVRLSRQTAPSSFLASELVTDTSWTINTSLVDGGYYLIQVTPLNAHNTCMEYNTTRPFVFSNKNGNLSISLYNSGSDGIEAYPNPLSAGKELSIELNSADVGKYTLSITNISGHIVYEEEVIHSGVSSLYTLPVHQLASGIYIVRCKGQGRVFVQKLTIQP